MNATGNKDLENPELANAALKDAKKKDEVDLSKVNPSEIPHHIIQQTPAFTGLLSEVQDMRVSNRQLKENVNSLQGELETRSKNDDPEELMNRQEVHKVVEEALEKQKDEHSKQQEQQNKTDQISKENDSLSRLRSDLPTEKVGEGLDADTVIREGGAWLMQNKPKLFAAARQSDDPAREVYNLSLAYVPSIKKRAVTKQNVEFLETIKTGSIPKGSGALGVETSEASALLKMIEMPEDDLLALIEKDELG